MVLNHQIGVRFPVPLPDFARHSASFVWASQRVPFSAKSVTPKRRRRAGGPQRTSSLRSQLRLGKPASSPFSEVRHAVIAAALVIATAACGSRGQPAAPTVADNDFHGQFNQLWSTFDRIYPYFDHKRIDWDALKAEFEPRAAAAASEDQLIAVLQPMLARLHDQHVVLTGPGGTVRTYVLTDFINWNEDLWRQYLARANASTRGAAVSAVMNGVAYIAVTSGIRTS
jgi:tricorn protease-like protein